MYASKLQWLQQALLLISAIPCSFYSLMSCTHSCLFLDWRRAVSSKFFDTQISSISTEELVLPRHARCMLSCLRCNEHSLLLSSYISRIGRIENLVSALVDTLSRTPLISFCTVQLGIVCATCSLATLYGFWSRPYGVARLLEPNGLPPCPNA